MSSYGMLSSHYDTIPRRGQAPRVYRGDVSNENLDSVNFPVDGFQRRRVPDAGPRGTERKRGILSVVGSRAKLASAVP